MSRLLLLGLDSMPPSVLYEGMGGVEFPRLSSVLGEARRWRLRSTYPPITIPAWLVMFTGLTPGELGIYGFRHRRPGDVRESYIVDSSFVPWERTLWYKAAEAGLRVGLFGVPPTYPPRPVHGFLVSDFTTPDASKPWAWPPWLRRELLQRFGEPIFDVVYRSEDKESVARGVTRMLEQHAAMVEYLVETRKWDLMIYVEIAVDRAHHAFWRYFDPSHPRFEEHPRWSSFLPEFYAKLDEAMWSVIEAARRQDPDTVVVIASDHGVKAMKGAFAVNEWLIEQGYLRLRREPRRGEDLSRELIDWERTVAWAWGGYYSRIFINLKGREPMGIVEPKYYDETVEELRRALESVKGPNGEAWVNRVYRPSEVYPEARGDAPDLMAVFDDLSWRAAGTLGWGTAYLDRNDRGPDDAVHDWYGVLAVYDPQGRVGRGASSVVGIESVASLLAELLGLNRR